MALMRFRSGLGIALGADMSDNTVKEPDEAKEPFDDGLTKAEASKRIDELQHKTGRGLKSEESGGQTRHSSDSTGEPGT
jgi:hypothetical protein